jgi:hypothetical protein
VARIRTIKPEFWIDERVGECSPTTRLLFIATWNFADDNGNLERSAKQLKAQAMPYDSIDCEDLILELVRIGLLEEYSVNGSKYLHISNFEKHQKIEKKSAARFPLPDSSPTTTQPVGIGREGKVEEGKIVRDSFSPLEAARGFLIEFRITGEAILRAAEQAIGLRAQLAKVDALDACAQLQQEYRTYLDSNPEFKKGPEKWLSQCNQDFETKKSPRKWKVVGNG